MTPTKILLLGATGPAGLVTLKRALSVPDVQVIVYARTPSKIPEDLRSNPHLTILPGGSLQDTDALRSAVAQRPDVIISLLGPAQHDMLGWMNPFAANSRTMIFADAYRVIIDAMKEYGVKRIYVMGTISIPDAKDRSSFLGAVLVWLVWSVVHGAWKNIVAVGKLFDSLPKEDGIEWTVFRLGAVMDGDFESVAEGYVADGKTTLSIRRSELAQWLVTQATNEVHEWAREKPVVTTAVKRND